MYILFTIQFFKFLSFFFFFACLLPFRSLYSLQVLRRKWTALYAARRRQRYAASQLPELPCTLFGWIPVLCRITEDEVLESAGLDAYVVSFGFLLFLFGQPTGRMLIGHFTIVPVVFQFCYSIPIGRFRLLRSLHSSHSSQIYR